MNQFDACMKEAQKLVTMTFCPALDALKRDDVASILDVIIIEADLVKEGHTDFPRMGVRRKLEQVARFVEKWAGAAVECEDEGYCIDFLREMGRDVSALAVRRAEIEAEREAAREQAERDMIAGYASDLLEEAVCLAKSHDLPPLVDSIPHYLRDQFLGMYHAICRGTYLPPSVADAVTEYGVAMSAYKEACRMLAEKGGRSNAELFC